jgi:hypothetical protein
MNTEDDEFNRIEREAAMRMKAVSATVAKREWVGLTDKEIAQLEETTTCLANESWLRNLTRAIEAKLKQKNT